MAELQRTMPPVTKLAENTFFKKPNGKNSTYATLDAVQTAATPVLTANGLSVGQESVMVDGYLRTTTRVDHVSGEWKEYDLDLPVDKKTIHGGASASTYGRRIGLGSALFICTEEDHDGNDALAEKKKKPKRATPEEAQPHIDEIHETLDDSKAWQENFSHLLKGYIADANEVIKPTPLSPDDITNFGKYKFRKDNRSQWTKANYKTVRDWVFACKAAGTIVPPEDFNGEAA